MARPRYCSWAPDEILLPSSVRRMRAEVFGGYCSLLVEAWLDPTGSLPDDPKELAGLARMSAGSWARFGPTILSLFYLDGGRYRSDIVDRALDYAGKKSEAGKKAVEERERRRRENRAKIELETGSTDDRPMIERRSKEKDKVTITPPPTPSETSGEGRGLGKKGKKPRESTKATRQPNPANDETWSRFDAAYPRPGNGRKLEVGEARFIWDAVAESGEDLEAIIRAVEAYAAMIDLLDKRKYVAMMTTWLNQRRWLESYDVDPGSDEGRRVQAARAAESRERKSAHEAKYGPIYEAWKLALAEAGIEDPAFVAWWTETIREGIARRRASGLVRAAEISERLLADPEAGRRDRITRWLSENPPPSFWEWDETVNPEGFKP